MTNQPPAPEGQGSTPPTDAGSTPPTDAGSTPPTDAGSKTDQILDLLLDALIERQQARRAQRDAAKAPVVPPPRPKPPPSKVQRAVPPTAAAQEPPPLLQKYAPPREPKPGEEGWEPPPRQPSIDMGKMLGRLLILVGVLILLVNIPVTRHGVSLARILPDSASLIIRDGLVLKGSGPEIYILELSLIHISEPTRPPSTSRMPSSA